MIKVQVEEGDKAIAFLKRHPQRLVSLSPHFTPEAASYAQAQPQAHNFFFTPHYKCLALHILVHFKLYRTSHFLAASSPTLPAPPSSATSTTPTTYAPPPSHPPLSLTLL
ncbi:hypothetical protein JHK82_043598 [Glycine max]|uniref:Uncharacterized protein n=1 Tax=Glycine max TaxID=3847 RepID=A0A0R0GGN0_SOYBN|nr:hypothetical protein JHK86_043485 [Glycine max]KAG5106628.1 hypothetical protein JHK82_043598 [Glycine max]KAG5117556.1 hypothetical protein JHK84_043669 [Glycine max]